MVGVTAKPRRNTGRSDRYARPVVTVLAVPRGVNEQFVRDCSGDAARARTPSRLGVLRARLRRLTTGASTGRPWRRTVLLGVLGMFAATFLMGIAGTPERSVDGTGITNVASAAPGDCFSGDLDLPGVLSVAEGIVEDAVNAVCRAFNEAARVISENVITPISNALFTAFHPNKFCFTSRTDINVQDPDSGISSLMRGAAELLIGKTDGALAETTWQQYGTAGTYWGTYFLDCYDSTQIANLGANFVFTVSKLFSMIAILLFQQTFNSAIVDYFFVPQGNPPAPEAAIDTIIDELHVGLFINFMSLAVVAGAIVLLYNSVLRGGGLADAASKIGMMALVVGIALTYVNYGSGFIQQVSGYTDDVGEAVLGALAGENCENSDGNPVPGNPEPYDCAAQTMYHVLIYVPWANGEIGTINVINDDVYTQQRRDLSYDILEQQAFSRDESQQINDPNINADERARLTQDLQQGKQDARLAMVRDTWGARFIAKDGQDEAPFAIEGEQSWRPHDHVDTDYPEYWNLFSGKVAGQRFIIAMMAMIGAFSLGLVLISVATAYIVLQLMTIVLALAAPIVFLVGLIPNYGYRIFLKWFELLAGLFIKRLALVVFVGVLLAGLQLVFSVPAPWWMHMVAAVCVGLAGLAYRHQLSSWASTGMEGVGKVAGVATGGLIGLKDGVKSVRHANATWQGSRGLPARHRAKAAAGAAYEAHQTGAGQRSVTQTRRQAVSTAAAQPLSRRQQRKARKAVRRGRGSEAQILAVQNQASRQAIEASPDGAQTGMGPQRSSRRGGYTYQA